MLKLMYVSIIKHKQQSYIRASIFRDEIAKHELQHILNAADKNVSLKKIPTTPNEGKDCSLPSDPPDEKNGIWSGRECK